MCRQRAGRGRRSFVGGVEKSLRVDDGFKWADARLEQLGDDFGAAKRQKHANASVVENCGLAVGVFLDAIGAEWRIDRHRNRAGH
jgi:hypothetical protein